MITLNKNVKKNKKKYKIQNKILLPVVPKLIFPYVCVVQDNRETMYRVLLLYRTAMCRS